MSRIFVTGWGAVSPAGWTVDALRDALRKDQPLPIQTVERPGWKTPLRTRVVPAPAKRPDFLAHPRLRRASPITHYAAAAALETTETLRATTGPKPRLGVVVCVQAGCVRYSCRFLDETFADPATASPLVFPETVYAAPASHVAALLENVTLACSLVGDPAGFLQAVAVGAEWLDENRVDACLVIGVEETNWVLAEALWQFDRKAVITAGAGALCLSREPGNGPAVELKTITNAHTFLAGQDRAQAALAMRAQLPSGSSADLLCDGMGGSPRTDAAELAAWRGWPGKRLSPKRILGDGLMASAAWQCVAACDALKNDGFPAASVSLVGSNQQAVGAEFIRATDGISRLSAAAGEGKLRP